MSIFPFSLSTADGGRLLAVAEAPKPSKVGAANRCLVVAIGVPSVRFALMAGTATMDARTVPAVDGVAAYSFTNPAASAGASLSVAVSDPAAGVAPLMAGSFTVEALATPDPKPDPAPEPNPEPVAPSIEFGPLDMATVKLGQPYRVPVIAKGMPEIEYVVARNAKDWPWRTDAKKQTVTGNDFVEFVPVEAGDFLLVMMAGNRDVKAFTPGVPAASGGGTPTPDPTPAPTPKPVPAAPADFQKEPAGFVEVFRDDFNRPAMWGVNALDPAKWGHRNYGNGPAHQGSSTWDNARGLEATGNSIRVHARRKSGRWFVDGFQHGAQNKDRNGYAFHAGWLACQMRFRARFSHAYAPGVGGYALCWPAKNEWSSEYDWLEIPGKNKNTAEATMHWDSRGKYILDENNTTDNSKVNVDLTQYHTWDCLRTIREVNGKPAATISVAIDNVKMPQPKGFIDNPYLCEPMMFGAASYVAAAGQAGWYGLPQNDTPDDVFLELDLLQIFAPK